MPRRRRLPPDTRPDWRDPNMPVIRRYTFGDGTTRTDIDPDYERRYREHLISIDSRPDYHRDPTYNMGKARKDRQK